MKNPTMSMKEWLFLILLSILWGGSFFFNEVILRELQPFMLVLGRTSIAAIILVSVVHATGRKMPWSLATWGSFCVMGALNNLIPFSLIVWGQQHIESGLASILNATTPLFTVALAHFLTSEEHLTLNRVIGVVLGVVGVAILIGPDALRKIGAQGIAQLAVLGAACSYGLAGIYGRRFRGMPSIIPAAGMLTCTAIMMLPIVVLIYQPRQMSPELTTWGALFGLAILSTALAYLIYFRILATAGATNILLVTFLIPISALLLGVFVLGERLEWTLFSGMTLIFAGLVGVDGRLLESFSTFLRLHKAQRHNPGLARR